MPETSILWWVAGHVPVPFSGRTLHRSALQAGAAGRYTMAETLFERAAAKYRNELEVEALARLRTHQLMTRARAGGNSELDEQLCHEVEERLGRFATIESLVPPFEPIASSALLDRWKSADGDHGLPGAEGVPIPRAA